MSSKQDMYIIQLVETHFQTKSVIHMLIRQFIPNNRIVEHLKQLGLPAPSALNQETVQRFSF